MPRYPVFTPQEISVFRKAIDAYRAPGAYEPGKWSVSPLNRRPEIVGTMPGKIVLRDIAVRTTEQMPGVVLPAAERMRLLQAVVEAGVPSVQVGAFGRTRSRTDMRADVVRIKEINPHCEVVYGGLTSVDQIQLAADVGIDNVQFWAAPYAEAAAITASNSLYRKAWADEAYTAEDLVRSVEAQLEIACQLVCAGHQYGVTVSVGINQLSFAPETYVIRYCQVMQEAGAAEIVLYDGSSGMSPEGYAHMVGLTKQYAPGAAIGVHTHNMFDLAVANALAAARAGATVLEVSVNGYCSASGQADLAATALALEALYGIPTGLDLARLTPLARLGEEITGYKLAWNHPVTGPEVYNWGGTEFVIQELKIDPLIHWCIEPSLVGNARRWDITFDSGPYTIVNCYNTLTTSREVL